MEIGKEDEFELEDDFLIEDEISTDSSHQQGSYQDLGSNNAGLQDIDEKAGLTGPGRPVQISTYDDFSRTARPKKNHKLEVRSTRGDLRKSICEEYFGTKSYWSSFKLSRILLKALHGMGYYFPTVIQERSIPYILSGRDVIGIAKTGSGKTAAFMLPLCQRLLLSEFVKERRRNKAGEIVGGGKAIKVLVLVPTRELALQCFEMTKKLTKYSCITESIVVGGLSISEQEQQLENKPDIIIATPGRIYSFLLNDYDRYLEVLDVLVLDEGDRLLDMGFKKECLNVIKHCPKEKQVILFSATLPDSVAELASFSMRNPIKIEDNPELKLSTQLDHVSVPVMKSKTKKMIQDSMLRESVLMYICLEEYQDKRIIVFCGRKKIAHRLAVLFSLCKTPKDARCGELHGSLSQQVRLRFLAEFNSNAIRILFCSELAGRGLDIQDTDIVINYNVPQDATRYIHQSGRTARLGRKGLVITLYDNSESLLLKRILRNCGISKMEVKRKIISPEKAEMFYNDIFKKDADVKKFLTSEHMEKLNRIRDSQSRDSCIKIQTQLTHAEAPEVWDQNGSAKEWLSENEEKLEPDESCDMMRSKQKKRKRSIQKKLDERQRERRIVRLMGKGCKKQYLKRTKSQKKGN